MFVSAPVSRLSRTGLLLISSVARSVWIAIHFVDSMIRGIAVDFEVSNFRLLVRI